MNALFFRIFVLVQLLVVSLHAADELIPFENSKQEQFYLQAVHQFGVDRAAEGYYDLFQDERVYRYYEGGNRKTIEQARAKMQSVAPRFQNWQGDKLGWVVIIDDKNEFQGFIGAAIENDSIEVCMALNPDLHRTKITTNAFIAFFSYFWPLLKPELRTNLKWIDSPINPLNEASCKFANSMCEGCVGTEEYTSPYYQNATPEKRKRVDCKIPINNVAHMLEGFSHQ